MKKTIVLFLAPIGVLILAIFGAYWWSNTPPKRPSNVSSNAAFLWAGHLGLPAPKHGTWIECWAEPASSFNKCKLTEMDGMPAFEGLFLANTGRRPVPRVDLKIDVEPTSDTTHWIRLDGLRGAPLVFLRDGTVLIPKDRYQEGTATLQHLRQSQGK